MARMWGHGLVRILRALPGDRVEVETRGGDRKTVRANTLTMVKRPNGEAPTKRKADVEVEDKRRTRDPERGDGWDSDDRGHLEHDDDAPAPATVDPKVLEAMDDDELAVMFGAAAEGSYSPEVADALAAEADRRDSVHDRTLHELDRSGGLEDDPAAFIAAADSIFPDEWLTWAGYTGPQGRRGNKKSEAEEAYVDYAEARMRAAEDATRGTFFNRQWKDRPLPKNIFKDEAERAFFYGMLSDAQIRKYASEELLRWFAENGRQLSLAEWLAQYNGWKEPVAKSGWLSEHG